MSQWRGLTAYLYSVADSSSYITHRDRQISRTVEAFSRAFAPWRNLHSDDKERERSLSAILTDGAELGVWLFSQPSELRFQWPSDRTVGRDRIVVTPALVKITDEYGQRLAQPQIMVQRVVGRV